MAELKTTDDLAPEQIAKQLLSSDSYHLIKIAQAYLELLKQRDGLLEDLNKMGKRVERLEWTLHSIASTTVLEDDDHTLAIALKECVDEAITALAGEGS